MHRAFVGLQCIPEESRLLHTRGSYNPIATMPPKLCKKLLSLEFYTLPTLTKALHYPIYRRKMLVKKDLSVFNSRLYSKDFTSRAKGTRTLHIVIDHTGAGYLHHLNSPIVGLFQGAGGSSSSGPKLRNFSYCQSQHLPNFQ